jgi:PAS domain S-box-containing protein
MRQCWEQAEQGRRALEAANERMALELRAGKESERKFSLIFQLSPDAIALSGLDTGVIHDQNESFTRLFGYSREESRGHSTRPGDLGIWIREEDRVAHIAELQANGKAIGHKLPMRRQDGSIFLCNLASSMLEIGGERCIVSIARDNTAWLQAEAALRLTTERLLLATRSARIGIWERDLREGTVVWDDLTFELLGLAPGVSPLSLDTWQQCLHPEDRARVLAGAELARRSDGAPGQEYRVVHPDGSVKYLQGHTVLVRDEQGVPIRIIGTSRDITEEKNAAIALGRSQERLNLALASSGMGTFEWNIQADTRHWDETAHRLLGTDPEPIPASTEAFLELVHPEDRDALRERIARALDQGSYESEFRAVWPDGSAHFIAVRGRIFPDEQGRPARLLGVLWDIGRRKLDEEALLRSDAAMRKISVAVEQSPVTVVITDTKGVIEYVNPKFTELTGYSAQEALGQDPRMLKSGETPREVYAELWATIQSGTIWKGEFHNRKKNGELFWESATIAPIKDAAGTITHFVAIKEDITGARRAKEALEQLNGELEARVRQRTALLEQANAELDAFSYSVSHDLRAPLRGIDGFSLAVLDECGDQLGEEARHYLQRIRAGTQRMGRLIDDLLKLSRAGRGPLHVQPLDLSAMALAQLENFRQGDARVLEVRVEPGLTAWGDPGLVSSVLANLLGNAWKYTCRASAARIELFREVQPDGLEAFCVRDNGIGFDMAYADKLFMPFQRLHSVQDFEGSGIGLAIVQRIVHRHGGQVWARGAVDQGASFCFTLPEPA